MTLQKEKPGVLTPWPKINQALALDERFEVHQAGWEGYLVAPRNLSTLSALAYLMHDYHLPLFIQGLGTSSPCPPLNIKIILSLRALNRIRLLEDQIIEVEAGCDLRTFFSTLLALKCEVGLEEWIWKIEKGSVGNAVLRGCQSGLLLREQSIQARILAVEMVQSQGGVIKLGRELEAACAGPHLHSLIWGIEHLEGILTKIYFKTYPLPQIRLSLCWSFHDRSELWKSIYELKAFTSSWERLDCVIPGHHQEKAFILAQISGVEEEIEAFKIFCPFFKTARIQDIKGQLKAFLLSRGFLFKAVKLEEYRQAIPYPGYLWYHSLINQCWLVTHHDMPELKQDLQKNAWKKDWNCCLTS